MPTEKAGCDEEQRGIRRGFTMALFDLSQALDGLKPLMAEIEAELARLAAKQKGARPMR